MTPETSSSLSEARLRQADSNLMVLRLTRPRLDFLVLISRYTGCATDSRGELRKTLASALGYSSTPATLRRILSDLEAEGLITTTVKAGKLYEVRLEDAGLAILEERNLLPTAPRRYLLDPDHFENRSHMAAQIASAITNLERYGRTRRFPADPQLARLEANYALHADLTPRRPDPAELAVAVARCRGVTTALADGYLNKPKDLDPADIDDAITELQELRLILIAARFAVDHPFPDL